VIPIRWLAGAAAALLAAAPQEAAAPAAKPALERSGIFVPANGSEVKLGLEQFSGSLDLVEVAAHGAQVREGDVVARFDTKAIDDQIEAAERDLRSLQIRQQNTREQARLDEELAAQRLEAAGDALNDAQEQLSNYEKVETELKKRGDALSESGMKDNIDDQKDELAQLEKMYTADELTDATEEIVLRRSRRQLARTQASVDLQMARRKFDADYGEKKTHDAKQKSVRDAQRNLDRTARQIDMEKRSRADALAKLDPELQDAKERVDKLHRDRDRLTVRAPASGILLHGGLADYRPGRAGTRLEVGGSVSAKGVLLTVAAPGDLAVALDVPESAVLTVTQGTAVKVVPAADASVELVGRLRYDRYPSPRSAGGPENTYDGTVEVTGLPPWVVAGMRCKVTCEAAKK
jgi:HlyD family secretion protein